MTYAKIDANQNQIVDFLRDAGASVQSLASLGKGVPDLLVGWRGINFAIEVKGPKGALTSDQAKWHREWRGRVVIVRSVEDCKNLLSEMEFP